MINKQKRIKDKPTEIRKILFQSVLSYDFTSRAVLFRASMSDMFCLTAKRDIFTS